MHSNDNLRPRAARRTRRVDELIAYHRQREADCAGEIKRAVEFRDEKLSKQAVRTWTEERQIARDTASYLETLMSRMEA